MSVINKHPDVCVTWSRFYIELKPRIECFLCKSSLHLIQYTTLFYVACAQAGTNLGPRYATLAWRYNQAVHGLLAACPG